MSAAPATGPTNHQTAAADPATASRAEHVDRGGHDRQAGDHRAYPPAGRSIQAVHERGADGERRPRGQYGSATEHGSERDGDQNEEHHESSVRALAPLR